MRLAPWVLLSIASLGCGGAARETAAGASAPLGVQSNAPRTRDVLRLRPDGPMAFATTLRVHLDSEMMGEPMSADFDTRGVRRVLGVQADGSLSMEDLETQTRYAITMMGATRTGPDAAAPVARHYVLGDRGRRIETPGSGPTVGTPGTEMQDQLEAALDPLVRALEFPEGPVAPGEEWMTSGRIPLGGVDPALAGEATFQVEQRLERFEGSGGNRVAVISFEGTLEGAGTSTAPAGQRMPGQPMPMPGQPMPGQPMDMARIAGEVRFRGFYVVAVSDGFARTAQADFEGAVQLGEGGILTFPLRGDLEWSAAPISTGLPEGAAPSTPDAGAL